MPIEERRKENFERFNRIEKQLDRLELTSINTEKLVVKFDGVLDNIIIDVDRLNQHKKNTEQTYYMVVITAIGLAGKTFWDFITKK